MYIYIHTQFMRHIFDTLQNQQHIFAEKFLTNPKILCNPKLSPIINAANYFKIYSNIFRFYQ